MVILLNHVVVLHVFYLVHLQLLKVSVLLSGEDSIEVTCYLLLFELFLIV